MSNTGALRCDGCGQAAPSEHVARRLQRLEWTTRYRPIHIGTLFLGAIAPAEESEFLYAAKPKFTGEAAALLEATGVKSGEKPPEIALAEFQRSGFFLAHVLECPLEQSDANTGELLKRQLPFVLSRIRRSLKPKRIAIISGLMGEFIGRMESSDLECTLLLDTGGPFTLDASASAPAIERLREALSAPATAGH